MVLEQLSSFKLQVISSGSFIVRSFRLQRKSQDQHEVEVEVDVVVDVRNWNQDQEFEYLKSDTFQPTLIEGKRKRQNLAHSFKEDKLCHGWKTIKPNVEERI